MLTDKSIKGFKSAEKQYKKGDARGLYLLVKPNGTKAWGMNYRRPSGTPNTLSFGIYPDVGLAQARLKLDAARKLIAAGEDPSGAKKEDRRAASVTFRVMAESWFKMYAKSVEPVTAKIIRDRLDKWTLPALGEYAAGKLRARDALDLLKEIEETGMISTMHRVKGEISRICCYAIAHEEMEYDITSALGDAVQPQKSKNRSAITEPARIGELMRACFSYNGGVSSRFALRILPYVFLRSGEFRPAKWSEFDLDKRMWVVPKERMKMHYGDHYVPLARQVIPLLKELHQYTGRGELLFPGTTDDGTGCISDGTMNMALKRMDFAPTEHVPHGFRTTFSTRMNEMGVNSDWIEMQLNHVKGNTDAVRATYNKAKYLDQRIAMMQQYADHLDELRDGGRKQSNVISFRRSS